MNPLIQTFMTYKEVGPETEVNNLPSETQPDMTLSLQELLERHVRGLDVPTFEGSFEEEGDFLPDPKTLDLADIARMREENAEKIKNLSEEVKKPRKQQGDAGAAPSGEADKPPMSGGQNESTDENK